MIIFRKTLNWYFPCFGFRVMALKATFNNILAIFCPSALLVKEIGEETAFWKSLTDIILYSIRLKMRGIRTHNWRGECIVTTVTTRTVPFSVYGTLRLGRIKLIWVNVQSSVQGLNYKRRRNGCDVTRITVLSIIRSMEFYHCTLRNK